MWIKQALVLVPIVLIAFLLQAVFWVPRVKQAANDPSRLDRLVFYMGATPEDMNIYQSTSATDSEISAHLNEGLLRYNQHYEIVPRLSNFAAVHHELSLLVGEDLEPEVVKSALQELYGERFDSMEPVEDWKLRAARLEEGENSGLSSSDRRALQEAVDQWQKVNQDPALVAVLGPVAEGLSGLRQFRIVLRAEFKEGQITSTVEPGLADELAESLGRHPASILDAKALVAELDDDARAQFAELTSSDKEDSDAMAEALKGLLEGVGAVGISHNPVVEFRITPGNHWTDGPFFDTPERTWMVLVDGEEAGYFRADTEEQVKELVRRRMSLEPDVPLTTWQFEETFRADAEDGSSPWWGKGPELTSRDVKLTLDMLRDQDFASPRMSSWLDVQKVRTFDDDPYRLEVVYRRLYSPAVGNLTGGFLPYHHWNRTAWTAEAISRGRGPADVGMSPEAFNPMRSLHAKSRHYSRRPSSIGPMVLYPLNGDVLPLWENGKLVRLLRNEFYTLDRQPAYRWIDYYIFNPQMGQETSEMVFNTGGIDLYTAQPHQVRRYEQLGDRYTLVQRQTTTYSYIGFNIDREPVNDLRVRKALAMALNVEDIIEYIAWGQGERISGPGYPVLPWYDHDYRFEYTWRQGEKKGETEQLPFIPFDQAEARALLEEAGFSFATGSAVKDGRPLEITITLHTGNPIRRDIAVLAQQQWGRLGINVKLEEHEWNVFLSQYVRPRNFTVCVLGWSGGLDFDKRQIWHSSYLPPTGLNFAGLKNEEADKVMEDILEVYDFETQVKMSHEMFRHVADELPYIFLYSPWSTTVVDPRIVWRKDPDDERVRPLMHDDIAEASAAFTFWMYELERLPERPVWTDEDFKN
jgi:ABC-type transport system substrate-binding protein